MKIARKIFVLKVVGDLGEGITCSCTLSKRVLPLEVDKINHQQPSQLRVFTYIHNMVLHDSIR